MSLTGIDPFDPLPADRREFIFATGAGAGGGDEDLVLLYGNKTSSGTEATDTIGDPIIDDADCIARFGRRSEIRWSYLKYIAVDKTATIRAVAAPEAGGSTAATVTFTFAAGAASDTTTLPVEWGGEKVEVVISSGDTAITQAANFAAKVNAASEGSWPFTAAVGGGGSEHIVTLTCANKGPRGDLILERVRATYKKTVTTTCTKGSVTGGSGADDFTAAYAEATKGTYFYQVNPCHATASVTSTDNQIGEGIEYIKTMALPAGGKEQMMFFGLVGTQAQATAVATSSAANSVYAKFYRSKNNPWTPGMIAAHHAAINRSQQIAYPAANLNGYTATDNTIYQVPAPYSKSDWPSETEQRADVNNGVSPVAFRTNGTAYLVRDVLSRSLNAQGNNDYRARAGHITRAITKYWGILFQRWQATKQPNVDDDLPVGATPRPLTSYPQSLASLAKSLIDDFTGPNPLGKYPGPILQPSVATAMKNSVIAKKAGAGKLSLSADLRAVEHLIGSETTLREVGDAY